ncbi:MAG TPA: cupin domain-containing protein [Gemmatimonadaceae bacterium]|nr:cupin domain-containing protein [Gemmatimonadaceae bacterium]
MIISYHEPHRRILFISAAVVCMLGACSPAPNTPPQPLAPAEIRVSNTSLGAEPGAGAVTRTTVYESPRTVTQVLRLAPTARIAEHHHPFFDETFLVQQGRVTLVLNGRPYDLRVGDFVVIPAGTVITGRNAGEEEARVVVAFSSTGSAGPLSVAGSPSH